MHRRLLALVTAVFMALPGTALAAEPTPVAVPGAGPTVVGHYYYLAAIEMRGETYKLEGKLWIEGDQLGASVGCNSMGARVTFDGTTLEILDGLMTTEMGCPDPLAQDEARLARALASGPFRWDGSGFAGASVRIVANDVVTEPVNPPDQVIVPPDGPISSEPEPLPGFDIEVCRDVLTPEEWGAIFGGSGAGSSSGGGTVDGSGIVTDPGVDSPGSDPLPPDGLEPALGEVTDPAPDEIVEPAPGDQPVTPGDPGQAGTGDDPTPPPLDPALELPVPDPATEPGPATSDLVVDQIEPSRDDVPVAQTKDGPAPTPSAELCRELLARMSIAGPAPQADGGPVAAPVAEKGANGGAEVARDLSATSSIQPEAAFTLVLLGGLILLAWLRTATGSPARRS